MKKLRKLLSDDQKNRRSRRNVLSIQITILGWLVEWAAFFTLVVGSYILGNKNNTVTMTLQCVTMLFYVIFFCSVACVAGGGVPSMPQPSGDFSIYARLKVSRVSLRTDVAMLERSA